MNRKTIVSLLAALVLCLAAFACASASESGWYAQTDGKVHITLPGDAWQLWPMHGETVITAAQGDTPGTFDVTPTGNASGWGAVAFTDGAGDVRVLSVHVDGSGAADIVQGEYSESLPLDKPTTFMHASGVGAWMTEMTVNPDGTFTGTFHDSDMGDIGDDYPNGTTYVSDFSGRFGLIFPMGENCWGFTLQDISMRGPGDEWIEDGVRYVSASPAGLDGLLYTLHLPGTPVTDLSEEQLFWWVDKPENAEALDVPMITDVADERAFIGE